MYRGLPFCNGGTEKIGDEERMSFLFCVAGTALVMISVILCEVTDNGELWITLDNLFDHRRDNCISGIHTHHFQNSLEKSWIQRS